MKTKIDMQKNPQNLELFSKKKNTHPTIPAVLLLMDAIPCAHSDISIRLFHHCR